jgi:RHS repeat-associated protein
VVTDTQNRLRWRWLAEPFGGSATEENPSGLGALTVNPRFPGQYFDVETGLSYNYFRDYDPAVGRYVQSDPIGLAGGINLYAYVENAPTMYTDSEGLFADKVIIGGIVGGIIVGGIIYSTPKPGEPGGGGDGPLGGGGGSSSSPPSSNSGALPASLPKTDNCRPDEWNQCYQQCGGMGKTKGCYVSVRWKTRMFRPGGGSINDPQRIVNCNCDDQCK